MGQSSFVGGIKKEIYAHDAGAKGFIPLLDVYKRQEGDLCAEGADQDGSQHVGMAVSYTHLNHGTGGSGRWSRICGQNLGRPSFL